MNERGHTIDTDLIDRKNAAAACAAKASALPGLLGKVARSAGEPEAFAAAIGEALAAVNEIADTLAPWAPKKPDAPKPARKVKPDAE